MLARIHRLTELDSPQSDIDSLGGESGSDWNIDIVDNEDAEAEVPEQGSCRISDSFAKMKGGVVTSHVRPRPP